MKIKTTRLEHMGADQISMRVVDSDTGRQLEISDLAWSDEIYLSIKESDREAEGDNAGFLNIIVPRKNLEKFLKRARKNARKYDENLPLVSEQLAELEIGTRFLTSDGSEYIKVGTDKYIETDENLMMAAREWSLGFLNAVDFDVDEGESRKIKVID